MSGNEVCTCTHVADEHGHDPQYPGSTACTVEDCGCLAFEEDVEATEAGFPATGTVNVTTSVGVQTVTYTGAGKRKKLPIVERIDAALRNGPLSYTDLWNRVFPAVDFPRRGGTPSRGGPPGSYMALSRAIDKYGFKWNIPDEDGTLATRIVYPRNPRRNPRRKK